MNAFRIVALASPLGIGFALPFLLAVGRVRRWSPRRSAVNASCLMAAWVLLLGMFWSFSGEPIVRWLESACFLLAFAAFLFGLFHLFLGLRLPPTAAQFLCGGVVALLVGTLFYFDPILEEAQESGLSREAFQTRVNIAMEWNPYAVMAYSIFEDDLLTHPLLYTRSLLADLQRSYPNWTRTALWYVLLGYWLYIIHLLLRGFWRRWRGR